MISRQRMTHRLKYWRRQTMLDGMEAVVAALQTILRETRDVRAAQRRKDRAKAVKP